jgi:FixJ family two-component response regulator
MSFQRRISVLPAPSIAATKNAQSTVIIVDDDRQVRDAVGSLLRSMEFSVSAFSSVAELMGVGLPNNAACLILDVRLPGRSGLEFQRDLIVENIHLPVIIMTGHGDIPMSVQAMKSGAIEFLTKPFRDQELLDAVELGLARDRARLEKEASVSMSMDLFRKLSPREREVMALLVDGRLNKQIAGHLGISEVTVKIHRRNLMRKMRALSLIDLARIADRLGIRRGDR